MNVWLLLEPQDEGMIYPDQLYHHGIKGMHWGVRRFQPYGPGQKVKGGKEVGIATKVKQRVTGTVEGIKQHRAARKKAAQVKKAQATRKANADYQAAKKKAIESGSIEDLAKFKGDLTNEEYTKAFLRLQNEKKMSDMVDANKETMFDKIDKGMKVVDKLAGYANTVSNFKEKADKLSDAFGGKEKKDAEKQAKEDEKNDALNSVTNITQLNELQKKYHFTQDEYNKALKNAYTKETYSKGKDGQENPNFVDQNEKAAREKAERDKADYTKWAGEQAWKQYTKEQAKNAWNAQKEAQRQAKREAKREANAPKDGQWWQDDNAPKDGQWWQDDPSMNNGPYSGGGKGGGYRGEKWGKRPASSSSRYGEVGTNKTNKLMLTMKDQTPSSYGAGKTPVGPFYKSTHGGYEDQFLNKKPIKGAKSGKSGVYTKSYGRLDFGDNPKNSWHYKRSGYKPSSNVEEMRRIVKETQEGKRKRKNFKP